VTGPTYAEVYAERWPTAEQVEAEVVTAKERRRLRADDNRAAWNRAAMGDGWRRKRRPVRPAR